MFAPRWSDLAFPNSHHFSPSGSAMTRSSCHKERSFGKDGKHFAFDIYFYSWHLTPSQSLPLVQTPCPPFFTPGPVSPLLGLSPERTDTPPPFTNDLTPNQAGELLPQPFWALLSPKKEIISSENNNTIFENTSPLHYTLQREKI